MGALPCYRARVVAIPRESYVGGESGWRVDGWTRDVDSSADELRRYLRQLTLADYTGRPAHWTPARAAKWEGRNVGELLASDRRALVAYSRDVRRLWRLIQRKESSE